MLRKIILVLAVTLVASTGAGPARADDTGGTGTDPVRTGDRTWMTQVKGVQYSGSGYHGGAGNVGVSPDFTPPPCWYGPRFDPAGAKDFLENHILPISDANGSISPDFGNKIKKMLQETGKLPYHQGEEGMWYSVSCGLDVPATAQAAFETDPAHPEFVWVGPGYQPAPGPTLDARMLAELARGVLTVPIVPIASNPDTAAGKPSTVNLPTWMWSAPAAVDVTAAIPGLASTVTARLEDIQITSVPAGAAMHPGGGDCGGLGAAFNGSTGAPPCGVTFGAPAAAVTVGIEAVWHLTWASTDGHGGDMGTVPFAQTLGFAVHEVQVLNGSNWTSRPR
ncbi:MAG: enoyl reductase [Mycobacteriales bacterium]